MTVSNEKRAPWRNVVSIETKQRHEGGVARTLTLSCGHTASRAASSLALMLEAKWANPPKKIRCLSCAQP